MFRPLLLAVTAASLACSPTSEPEPRDVLADAGAHSYSRLLTDLDTRLAAARDRPGAERDWTIHSQIASLHLARARLAGGYTDYDDALDALDRAFALAADGGGPHQVEAQVLASLHRLPEARAAIDRATDTLLLSDRKAASLDLLASEVAWQAGDYERAIDGLADVHARRPTFSSHARVGHQTWHQLDDAAAAAAFDAAEDAIIGEDPLLRSWLHLQRGILDLDRGRLDEALTHYHDADAAMPGWWLVQEHIAEVWMLTGHEEQAEVLYVDIVQRTDAPEFMDALAELSLSRGDDAEAGSWITRARTRYDAQLADHPEAAAGHALGHYLTFAEPDEAIALAQANVAARPNAEAHLQLAAAWLRADRIPEARASLDRALDTPWRNGELFEVQAAVEAAEQRTR